APVGTVSPVSKSAQKMAFAGHWPLDPPPLAVPPVPGLPPAPDRPPAPEAPPVLVRPPAPLPPLAPSAPPVPGEPPTPAPPAPARPPLPSAPPAPLPPTPEAAPAAPPAPAGDSDFEQPTAQNITRAKVPLASREMPVFMGSRIYHRGEDGEQPASPHGRAGDGGAK